MALATAHVVSAGIDIQPLDLSIRPRREKHWPLQLDILERDQTNVTTACKFNLNSAGSERLSPCMDPPDSNRRHQHTGLLSSLLSSTDLTFYTGRHRSSSICCSRGHHQRKSPYHLPPRRRSELCQEDSFVQQSSVNTDEDVCLSRDFATSCCPNPGCDVSSQICRSAPSPQDPADHHPRFKPRPFTTASLAVTSSVCQSGNSPMYSQWETTETDYLCRGNPDDIREFSCDPYHPLKQHSACRDTICDHLDAKSATGYEVGRRFGEDTRMCPASYFPESPQTPQGNWQEQLSAPDSPDLVSSSTPCPWGMYSDNPSAPFSKPPGELNNNSHLLEQPGMYTNLEIRTQHVPSFTEAPRLNQPARSSLTSKDNTRWKQHPRHKPTSLTPTGCDQVSTSTDAVDITGHRYQTLRYPTETNLLHRSSTDNVNSTQVSILDFWISKFLSEPIVETSSREKPCHVEYICSEGGQKKIRFRLVDLMELQVEQSLMA